MLPKVSPYRDYVAWLAAQDHEAGLAYWREQLADLRDPFRLAIVVPRGSAACCWDHGWVKELGAEP